MTIEVTRAPAALGAEVRGVDLSRPLSAADFDAIQQAWYDHSVLLFRQQRLSDDDLIRFSKLFGELDLSPASATDMAGSQEKSRPEIWIISNVVENGRPCYCGSKGCLAGQLICLIDVDGKVLPCSYFPKSGGNIREQSFQDIWEKSELFLELRDFKGYKDNCGRCEYVNVCGGCRARAYAMSGDYLAQEPFCSYQPRT